MRAVSSLDPAFLVVMKVIKDRDVMLVSENKNKKVYKKKQNDDVALKQCYPLSTEWVTLFFIFLLFTLVLLILNTFYVRVLRISSNAPDYCCT